MKRVVSVSLGSAKRDHAFETDFMGEHFLIERIGTNGDWDKAINLIRELDGKVDAFGMGGIDLYVHLAGKPYVIKDAKKLIAEAEKISQKEFGFKKISVISGIGVREYYRKLGYRLQNTYMAKKI